jgi:GNAT superfamily N-acetyltransferase
VATDESGAPVGHVALHDASAESVMDLACHVLGADRDELAVVARLFVDPKLRNRGVGGSLLRAVAEAAAELGRRPILDVWRELDSAIALYEHAGWVRIGEVTFTFSSSCTSDCLHTGSALRSVVYSAP